MLVLHQSPYWCRKATNLVLAACDNIYQPRRSFILAFYPRPFHSGCRCNRKDLHREELTTSSLAPAWRRCILGNIIRWRQRNENFPVPRVSVVEDQLHVTRILGTALLRVSSAQLLVMNSTANLVPVYGTGFSVRMALTVQLANSWARSGKTNIDGRSAETRSEASVLERRR